MIPFAPNVNSGLKPFDVTLQTFNSVWGDVQGPFSTTAKTPEAALANAKSQFTNLPAAGPTHRFHVYDKGSYTRTNFDLNGVKI